MHGEGVFTNLDGETKRGEWRDGVIYQWFDAKTHLDKLSYWDKM